MLETKICRHGRLTYFAHDEYVGRALAQYGDYSEAEVALVCALAAPGDVAIIAGANIGAVAVPLATRVAELHAFEPQHPAYQLLRRNIAANQLTNVTVYDKALGARPSRATSQVPDYNLPGNFGRVMLETGDDIEIATVDGLGLDRVDLIHADVEGMEADLVRGALKTIARCRPLLYLECDRGDESLLGLLKALEYRAWWHEPLIAESAEYGDALLGAVSFNLLCAPLERGDIGRRFGLREAEYANPRIYGRLMPLPDREPSIPAALANPHSADIQAMQAEAQFESGLLSSRELGKFELTLRHGPRVRHLFNPFTGEYRQLPAEQGWSGGGTTLIGWS